MPYVLRPRLCTSLLLSGIVSALLAPTAAWAVRKVALPTMEVSTMHGGVMTNGGGATTTCVTANMLASANYQGGNGVKLAYHIYTFNFKNLSAVGQNLTLTVLPGTKVESQNSEQPDHGIPTSPVKTKSITTPHNLDYYLGPNADGRLEVAFFASADDVTIVPVQAGISDGPEQVCIGVNSTLSVSLQVAEDRGAVLASVTAKAHRGYGMVDLWMSAPISFQINGGRPF